MRRRSFIKAIAFAASSMMLPLVFTRPKELALEPETKARRLTYDPNRATFTVNGHDMTFYAGDPVYCKDGKFATPDPAVGRVVGYVVDVEPDGRALVQMGSEQFIGRVW